MVELSNRSNSEAQSSEAAVDSDDIGEVIHNDFGHILRDFPPHPNQGNRQILD